jgi:hypothetical protein
MANRPGLITEMSEPRRVLWTLWKNFEDMSFTRDAGGAALEAFTLIQAAGTAGTIPRHAATWIQILSSRKLIDASAARNSTSPRSPRSTVQINNLHISRFTTFGMHVRSAVSCGGTRRMSMLLIAARPPR